MGYAIITQKLMNIDIIIRRGLVYGLVTFVMAAIMSAAILIVGTLKEEIDTPRQIVIALGLGIIAAALFGPVKKGIEILLDKFFYKDRYDYRQTIQSLSDSLKTVRDFPEISRLIVAAVADALNLAGACLYIKSRTIMLDIGATQGIFTDGERQLELSSILTPSQRNSSVEFPNPAKGVLPDLAFIIPLVAGDREVGVLCLSEKISRQGFSANDLYLTQGISSVAAIALRSASLMQDVSIRNTFVSIASHELNTPLTSVIGYSELLLKRNLQPNERRWVKQIFDSGRRIATIVDDLLDITRIQSGRVILKLDKVKLEDVFTEHLSMARETSNAHEFIVGIPADVPKVYVDRDKFGQVIWNLLSNAIKYSPNGGRISITARHEPEKFRVVVSVADQGMGIGPADRDSLFTTFHRIKRPETVSIKGAGLGLYIVKQWTEAMGGQVWLESELNKGSTFFVTVPTVDTRNKARL
jgi:signal transduction histidine kinase